MNSTQYYNIISLGVQEAYDKFVHSLFSVPQLAPTHFMNEMNGFSS